MCAICGSVGASAAAAGTANAASPAKANKDLEIIGPFPSGGTMRRCGKPLDGAWNKRFPRLRFNRRGSHSALLQEGIRKGQAMEKSTLDRRAFLGVGAAAIVGVALLRSP